MDSFPDLKRLYVVCYISSLPSVRPDRVPLMLRSEVVSRDRIDVVRTNPDSTIRTSRVDATEEEIDALLAG